MMLRFVPTYSSFALSIERLLQFFKRSPLRCRRAVQCAGSGAATVKIGRKRVESLGQPSKFRSARLALEFRHFVLKVEYLQQKRLTLLILYQCDARFAGVAANFDIPRGAYLACLKRDG